MNDLIKNKKALYMEFQNGGFTVQLLITPEGEKSGSTVPLVVYRRRVSADSPKSQWKGYPAATKSMPGQQADSKHAALNIGKLRISHLGSLVTQLQTRGYTLVNQPFVVDFTQEDLADTCGSKTPYKVLNRVLKCRTYLGFADLPKAAAK
jgi:hypothetical protein